MRIEQRIMDAKTKTIYRVRCAMAVLEVAGRQVQTIRHIDYFMLPFDDKGRVDKKEWNRGLRLALEILPSVLAGTHPKHVIDARDRFMEGGRGGRRSRIWGSPKLVVLNLC